MDDNNPETYPQENEVEISGSNQIKSPTTSNLNQTLSDFNQILFCSFSIAQLEFLTSKPPGIAIVFPLSQDSLGVSPLLGLAFKESTFL